MTDNLEVRKLGKTQLNLDSIAVVYTQRRKDELLRAHCVVTTPGHIDYLMGVAKKSTSNNIPLTLRFRETVGGQHLNLPIENAYFDSFSYLREGADIFSLLATDTTRLDYDQAKAIGFPERVEVELVASIRPQNL